MGNPKPNGWLRAYAEAPEILHAFAEAEDPDSLLADAFVDSAGHELRGAQVLEIGCGTCRLSSKLAQRLAVMNWIGLDSAEPLLKFACHTSADLSMIHARAERLPFADHVFDAVFASWVMAYLRPPSLLQCLEECRRVLRPGGSIWAIENAEAGPSAMPLDGNVAALLSAGFEIVRQVDTELRFPDQETARSITRFLMADDAPDPDELGRIPHRVSLLRLIIR